MKSLQRHSLTSRAGLAAHSLLITLGLFSLALVASAQEKEEAVEVSTPIAPAPTVEEAVSAGVAILLKNQENYATDPSVGGMPDEELEKWQAGERDRLDTARRRASKSKKNPPAEWPYEGVYRLRLGRNNHPIPPGYRVGGTAIVCDALLRAPGFDSDATRQAAVQRGVTFCLDLLKNDKGLIPQPQGRYDVRGWGQAYALNLFLEVSHAGLVDEASVAECKEMIPVLIESLQQGVVRKGGWNYAGEDRRVSPFMTGPTLLFLFRAVELGYEVPESMIVDALDALEKGRNEESGAFAYSGTGKEPMAASSGRAAVAELALLHAGRGSVDQVRVGVHGFFDNWEHLLDRKSKQGTHLGKYKIAPYYFFFAHTYAAMAIEALPEKERADLRTRMHGLLWQTREGHGAWNDRIFPRTESYCTAMSVLALLAPDLPKPADWRPHVGAHGESLKKK